MNETKHTPGQWHLVNFKQAEFLLRFTARFLRGTLLVELTYCCRNCSRLSNQVDRRDRSLQPPRRRGRCRQGTTSVRQKCHCPCQRGCSRWTGRWRPLCRGHSRFLTRFSRVCAEKTDLVQALS